jgi:hypothetical protein
MIADRLIRTREVVEGIGLEWMVEWSRRKLIAIEKLTDPHVANSEKGLTLFYSCNGF